VRLVMTLLPFLAMSVAACDKQSAPASQANQVMAKAENVTAVEEPKGTIDRSQKGKQWPVFKFAAPNGDMVSLADFKGRPVLMNLWATWCAPCIRELPSIEKLAAREANKLQVLVISQDMEGAKVVNPWWQQQNFKLLQSYIDAKADFSFNLGGGGALPVTVLYNADGKEVWRVVGPMDWAGEEAAKLIAEAGQS
jgi:thiol-disulfide isomerase/thioredoxin